MKQIRKGEDGEVTAEIFETWFPDKPEVVLMDFIKSKYSPTMILVHWIDDYHYVVSHINRDYAKKLLDEFKILRGVK